METPLNDQSEEWVNPDAPPHTDDAAEGVRMLDEPLSPEDVAAAEEEARRRIEEAGPEEQHYLVRMDSGKVVKDQREYNHCITKRIALKAVTYDEAIALVEQEEEARRVRKEKKDRRKRNRRHGRNR